MAKNKFLYLVGLVVGLMTVSCQKDIQTITAEIEHFGDNNGKVYINAEGYACWHHGDKVTLNNTKKTLIIGKNEDNIEVATIAIDPGDKGPFTAAYPSQNVISCDGGTIIMDFPRIQNYREVRTPQNHMLQQVEGTMVAYADGDIMKFRNAGALMKVVIPNNLGEAIAIRSIELIGDDNVHLHGVANIIMNQNDMKPSTIMLSGGNTVKLNFPRGYGKIASNATGIYYIAVPPVSTTFRVKVYYATPNKTTKCYTSIKSIKNSIKRNYIVAVNLNINDVSRTDNVLWIGDGSKEDPYQITNAEQLSAINQSNDGYAGKYFRQESNIAIDPSHFNKVGTPDNPFRGEYDGNRQNITFTEAGEYIGIFDYIGEGANIHDLTVENKLSTTINTEYNREYGGIADVILGNATISNCNVMGIVNLQNDNNTDDHIYVGGICGFIEVGKIVNIKNCFNSMSVIVHKGTTDQRSGYVGGICGYIKYPNNVTIQDCGNMASLAGFCTGGTIGVSNAQTTINRCTNNGTITCGVTPLPSSSAGGIVGTGIPIIKNCANHGAVKSAKFCGGLLGYGYNYQDNAYPTSIINSYSDGNIYGLNSTTNPGGGIIGLVELNYSAELNNVYVGGNTSNAKWICGWGNTNCTHVYSPSADQVENGCMNTTQYNPETWKIINSEGVESLFLKKQLNSYNYNNESWKGDIHPQLNFENRLFTSSIINQ